MPTVILIDFVVVAMSRSRKNAIAVGFAIILKESENSSYQRKRKWVKEWLAEKQNTHRNLIKELTCEPDDWRNYMRMDEDTYAMLLKLVSPLIERQDTNMRQAITPYERLSATLRFLATGCSLKYLRYSVRIGTSTLSEIIPETCSAIFHVHRKEVLEFPKSEEDWMQIGNQFEKKWNFPNCLGAVDGKHVQITPPKDAGSYFYNYKGYNSLVLMAVVNANYEFIYADVGTKGRISDGGVLGNTSFGQKLKENKLKIPQIGKHGLPRVFVGDEAFALRPDFLRPFPQRDLNHDSRIFNYRLSRARTLVENAFGILAARFRIYHTSINLKLQSIEKVVLATIALHNYLRRKTNSTHDIRNDNCDDMSVDGNIIDSNCNASLERGRAARVVSEMARNVREKFMKYFTAEGSVEWQNNVV